MFLSPQLEQLNYILIFSLSCLAHSFSSCSSSCMTVPGNLQRHMGQLTPASSWILCLAQIFRHYKWKLLPHLTIQKVRDISFVIASWQIGHTESCYSFMRSDVTTALNYTFSFFLIQSLGNSLGTYKLAMSNTGRGRLASGIVCFHVTRSYNSLSTYAACQIIGLSTLTRNIFRKTYAVWMQWSFRLGAHEHFS